MSDLISRQAAIDALGERPMVWTDDDQYTLGERNQYDRDRLTIKTLPAVQPEREKGKWVYGEDEYGVDGYRCDKCGFFVLWDYGHNFINYIGNYNFCPSCGADMRGEEDK